MKVKKGVATITTSSSENYTVDVVTFEIDGVTHALGANVTDGRYETYPPYNFSIHDNVDLSTESGTIAFFRNATGYDVSSYTWTTALVEVDAQKVLWSGGWYMTAGHTVNLSENVSDQKNGIVLVWSAYENGASKNYDWHYTFVPKHMVGLFPGTGISTGLMINSTGAKVGNKYVYVHNDKVVGNDHNSDTATVAGITHSNNYWVLRYVLGV